MDTSLRTIDQILSGNTRYDIPVYQRPYRWVEENIDALLQDVWDSCERGDKEYFLGSIIFCKTEKNGKQFYEIVDGQQRLITITLVLRELAEQIEKKDVKQELIRRIFPSDAFNETETKEPTLTVRRQEKDVYKNIIEGKSHSGKMTKNEKKFVENKKRIHEFFHDVLKGNQNSLWKFAQHLIKKVQIIEVLSDDRLSSFRLFKVLNDRGMSLAYTDLLKNELIEKAYKDGGEQLEQEVAQQWAKLEDVVREIDLGEKNDKSDDGKSMELFFSILQVSEKTNRDRVRNDIYTYYKERLSMKEGVGGYQDNSVKMIGDILASAQRFRDVCDADSSKKTMSFLKGFYKNTMEWAPAVMAFLNHKDYGMGMFPEFAELLEKVYVQQWFIGETASKREAPRYYTVEAINTGKSANDTMGILHKLAENDKVATALRTKDFYEKGAPAKNNFIKLVLLRLSAKIGEGDVQTEYSGDITVEHILPEKWEEYPYWKQYFTEEQYDEWLNRIGNLTVIGRKGNSKMKNKGFDEKKEVYETSNFVITSRIGSEYEEWNIEELNKRHEKLIKDIEGLWLVK